MGQFLVRLDEGAHTKLKARAEENGESMNTIVCRAVDNYLNRAPARPKSARCAHETVTRLSWGAICSRCHAKVG